MDFDNKEIFQQILDIKKRFGEDLIVLAHHYQRPEIVSVADEIGDSYVLCKKAQQSNARYIVFCGVRFMAESAEILRQPHQMVFHPEPFSGCPMSDMAEGEDVQVAFNDLDDIWGRDSYIPIVYMNSSAEVKSLAGMHNGIICTSSNAEKIVSYAFLRGKKVFFIPDEYLGFNTYKKLGRDISKLAYWDFSLEDGGNDPSILRQKDYLIWKGYCHVHTFFSKEHILKARERFKGCKIVVHPECKPEVVDLADASGSTEFIVRYVKELPSGSTVVIGTELNLIRRLSDIYKDRRVLDLARSVCPNMFKITLSKLRNTLENIPNLNRLELSDEVKEYAKEALIRMLEITG